MMALIMVDFSADPPVMYNTGDKRGLVMRLWIACGS